MGRRLLLVVLLSAPCCLLKAQEADTLAPAQVFSVQSMPVIKAAEEASLYQLAVPPSQVADILRFFTGVQVKDYGGAGGLKTINVRSLGSEHVGIFLDGIQVDNAQNMQVDLGRFSTESIGQIQLYNAQKSTRLQSAKAYASGAVVHLQSQWPVLLDKSGGRVSLRGGAFGTIAPSLQWDQRISSRLQLQASAAFVSTNGRYPYPCFDTTLVRENGDLRSLRLEARLLGQVRGGSWNVHLYTYGSERGFPGPVIRRAQGFPFSAERQSDQDIFVQGGWQQEWSARYAMAIKFKYSRNYTHYDTHPEKNPMAIPYDLHYLQQSAYLSVAQSYILADFWSVDLATDVQFNALDSDAGAFVTPRRTSFYGALATRLAWEKIRASAQVVYQGSWDTFDTPQAGGWSRENAFRNAWMPAFSIWASPWRWLEVDAYAKSSYRLPSFNDLYYSLIGNAALEPEQALQAGADVRATAHYGAWHWDLRVSPYWNSVRQKIVAIPTLSQFRWTMLNIGRVETLGLDACARTNFHYGPWTLDLALRYSLQRALDRSTPGSSTYGNQIPYIPLHSGSICFSAAWKDWELTWDSSFTGSRWSRTANIPDYYLAPWSITDVSLGKLLRLHPLRHRARCPELRLGLTCGNLFNQPYQIVQGYPMPGINLMGNMSFSW